MRVPDERQRRLKIQTFYGSELYRGLGFVDHKSNYCRVFLARTKDQAAKKSEHFLTFFEKRFNCRVHVLQNDGGGEYKNVDLLCKSSGVARQVSEARQ
ncbi:unnamed protein product [Peronospora farinosa]|uniref:Integrase catalytic domain-containing protein n=1 Tax=Peronospora farinosa TaxID=134698 RepID=A0ABN8C5B0_9STRA|nr:unnamed protein product [Peronospora farinosa]